MQVRLAVLSLALHLFEMQAGLGVAGLAAGAGGGAAAAGGVPGRRAIALAVGSMNPVKLNAAVTGVRNALQPLQADGVEVELATSSYDVASGVSAQPLGTEETKTGALNRAKAAFEAYRLEHGVVPDYAVGLEGGITDDGTEMTCSAWMAVFDGSRVGTAHTCSFLLPPAICELVRGGMELGAADDAVFGTTNSKQKGGTVGHLTRGSIDRTRYYVPAVELAMVPLLWPDLWPDVRR